MKRRDFLLQLPGLGIWVISAEGIISRVLARQLLNSPGDELVVYPAPDSPRVKIPIWWQQDVPYVSATALAHAFQYHTYFNQLKRKLVVYLPFSQKIVLAAENPFIKIDDKTLQMPLPARWRGEDIFVPIPFLVPLINQYVNINWEYDPVRLVLQTARNKINVFGSSIAVKENGIVIRIRTTQTFHSDEMSANFRNNWLFVDLYKGRGDEKLLRETSLAGYVKEIDVIQSAELLSIGYRLSRLPLEKEIYQDQDTNEVVVVLRYKDKIEDSEIAEEEGSQAEKDIEEQLEEERNRWLIDTVLIDAGHGGKDPGAIGVGRLREKDIVLSIALKLGALIEKKMPGVRVIYTRDDDKFVELRRRTQIANESRAKVFISIHANSNHNRNVRGFETYILGPEKGEKAREVVQKENSVIHFEDPESQKQYEGINLILATMAQSAFMKHSEHLAASVQNSLYKKLKSAKGKSRGVKQAPFWVMVGASMPSILVEVGFVTNPYEARKLRTAKYQQKIAEGIFEGLKQFKEDYESVI
ncbi:MAG: N-acetylmuramoyl-L-alanine amidase [Calditrichaeota bacterium]|nr:MAG: N-acetylmuramoyl-L-alanine amidase [Calditrichota bacterium]